MTQYVPPKKNDPNGFVFYTALSSRTGDGTFLSNPTLAAGDVKVSVDGAAYQNLGTLPAVTPAGVVSVKVTLAQGEINGDNIVVKFQDAAGAEWCDKIFNFQTVSRQLDDLAYPNTSGRGIDVTAGGEVGIDWANIGSPTTTIDLSGTTVKTATDVETDTQDIQNRLPAALTGGGNMKADALAISGDTVAADNAESFFDGTGYAGTNNVIPTVTTVTNLTNAPTNGDLTAAMKASVATAVLTTQMTESYAANGSAPTLAQAMFAIHQDAMDFTISGTSYTVKKLDNSTTAFVKTLNDGTSPTAAART